jgi:Ammonium Transporter Family
MFYQASSQSIFPSRPLSLSESCSMRTKTRGNLQKLSGALITMACSAGAWAQAAVPAAVKPVFNGGDTAWLLISTVLVLLMTIPGIMLFYSGMLRSKNALSVVAHIFAATTIVTLTWTMLGYSLAFTTGNSWIGGLAGRRKIRAHWPGRLTAW